jgi:hypothetical protein
MKNSNDILEGGVDLHTHCGPDFYPRSVDQFELAEKARSEKMAGVVFKNHFCPTYFAAEEVGARVAGIHVFGGLVLNHYVGGLNVSAVDLAVKAGAKIVWMPTLSEENHLAYYGASDFKMQTVKAPLLAPKAGLTICEKGRLKPEIYLILEIICSSESILATGHVSTGEALVLVREAAAMGIKKILINHPDDRVSATPREAQREMIRSGALVEHALITTMPGWGELTIEGIADNIRQLGAENCVLVTDFGQTHHEIPTEGLKTFVKELLACGMSEEEIRIMLCTNPCRLLGIS